MFGGKQAWGKTENNTGEKGGFPYFSLSFPRKQKLFSGQKKILSDFIMIQLFLWSRKIYSQKPSLLVNAYHIFLNLKEYHVTHVPSP